MNKLLRLALFIFCSYPCLPNVASAEPEKTAANELPPYWSKTTEFSLREDPARPRAFFWPAFFSVFLPGLDQWIEKQDAAPIYSGVAVGGLVFSAQNIPGEKLKSETKEQFYDRAEHGETERKSMLGMQLYMGAGSLSAYHSFRSAVRTQQPYGKFGFLRSEDSMQDILLAPFDYTMLTRPTTFVPLGIIAAVAYLQVTSAPRYDEDEETRRDGISNSDAFYASAISYNAGTNEEAMFRGWLMPAFREATGSDFWSNSIQSVIFAALHLSGQNQAPVVQLGLGWYLGYLTQENQWSIRESIFIHAWWDVFALLASYQLRHEEKDGKDGVLPPVTLPMLEYHF